MEVGKKKKKKILDHAWQSTSSLMRKFVLRVRVRLKPMVMAYWGASFQFRNDLVEHLESGNEGNVSRN